jgi:hypothetical protein
MLLTGLNLLLMGLLIGCGDNESHLVSNTTENPPTHNLITVSGVVEASYLKGVKICVKNTEDCAITGDEGNFTIETTSVLPITFEIKVGDSIIGEIKSNSEFIKITPLTLAENNETLAGYIGAMLHKVSSCDLAARKCDLSGVKEINVDEAQVVPLVKEMMKKLSKSDEMEIKANGKIMKLSKVDAVKYMSINPTLTSKKLKYLGYSFDKKGKLNVKLDLDKKMLNYMIIDEDDKILVNKTSRVVNKYQNVVFSLKDDNNSFSFFSPSYGAIFREGGIEYAIEVPDINITPDILKNFINKSYNLINLNMFNNYSKLTLKSVNVNLLKGTYMISDFNSNYVGVWNVKGNYIRFLDSEGKKVMAYGILKMGVNKNIIVLINPFLLELGIEAKPISASEVDGTYYYLRYKITNTNYNVEILSLPKVKQIGILLDDEKIKMKYVQCYGKAIINGTSFSFKDEYCSDSHPEEGNETLIYNPKFMDGFETEINLEGLIMVKNKSQFIIINKDIGMFSLIDINTGTYFFGSSKPLQ